MPLHLKEEEQQAEVSVRPADVDTPLEGDSVEDRILAIADMQQSGLGPTNNCSMPKWTCLMFCTRGRRTRLRLLCSMGGCGKIKWMTMKRNQSWSPSYSHFTH